MPKGKKRRSELKAEEIKRPEFKCRFETFIKFLSLIRLKTTTSNASKYFGIDCVVNVKSKSLYAKFLVSNWGHGEIEIPIQAINKGKIPIGDVDDVIETLSKMNYNSKDTITVKIEEIAGKGDFMTISRKVKRKKTRFPIVDESMIESIKDVDKITFTKKGRIIKLETPKMQEDTIAYLRLKAEDIGALVKEVNYLDVKYYPFLIGDKKLSVTLEASTNKESMTEIVPESKDGKTFFYKKGKEELLVFFRSGVANIFENLKGLVDLYIGEGFLFVEQNVNNESKSEPSLRYMLGASGEDDEAEIEEVEDLDEEEDEDEGLEEEVDEELDEDEDEESEDEEDEE